MLPEALLAAAAAGGAAVVQAAGTDAWTTVRGRLARFLPGGGDEERERALQATHAALAAVADPDAAAEQARQAEVWTARFRVALEQLPVATRELMAAELHALLDDCDPAEGGGARMTGNVFNGPAVNQFGNGNHQTINLGPGA